MAHRRGLLNGVSINDITMLYQRCMPFQEPLPHRPLFVSSEGFRAPEWLRHSRRVSPPPAIYDRLPPTHTASHTHTSPTTAAPTANARPTDSPVAESVRLRIRAQLREEKTVETTQVGGDEKGSVRKGFLKRHASLIYHCYIIDTDTIQQPAPMRHLISSVVVS